MSIYWSIRNFISGVGILLFTAICTVIALMWLVMGESRQLDFIRWWARTSCWICRLDIDVQGLENLPPESEGVLYLFNHQSLLDIPALHSSLPVNFRFGAKSELFKVPVFGTVMVMYRILRITRHDKARVAKLYSDSVQRVKNGESFILAPEGTRNPNRGIKDFKSGPFIFAIQCQARVVPVVIKGLYETLPKTRFFPHVKYNKVTMRVLEPIGTEGLSVDDRKALKDKLKNKMTEVYDSI